MPTREEDEKFLKEYAKKEQEAYEISREEETTKRVFKKMDDYNKAKDRTVTAIIPKTKPKKRVRR